MIPEALADELRNLSAAQKLQVIEILAHELARGRAPRQRITAALVGIGAAFLGFHLAMLSNLATGVIIMPFAVALVVSLLVSFALRAGTR